LQMSKERSDAANRKILCPVSRSEWDYTTERSCRWKTPASVNFEYCVLSESALFLR